MASKVVPVNNKPLVQTLYRCLLKDTKSFSKLQNFALQHKCVRSNFGRGGFVVQPDTQLDVLTTHLPELKRSVPRQESGSGIQDCGLQTDVGAARAVLAATESGPGVGLGLAALVRAEFKAAAHLTDSKAIDEKIDLGFRALRVSSEQDDLNSCSSLAETQGLVVRATSSYLPLPSDVRQQQYMFLYQIRVHNTSDRSFRVDGRGYRIEDAAGHVEVVPEGSPGVVGMTPVLEPGDVFEWCSGTTLATPTGKMGGSLQVVAEAENTTFDATVAEFSFKSQQ